MSNSAAAVADAPEAEAAAPAKPGNMKKAASERVSYSLPPLPSLLTKPLGLEGWAKFEPVLLAALVTEEPMLLIGPHGTAKSFMLERLAQVLGLEYRFYNASLLNYDDLVGIPMPDETRTSLRYISTPTAIWDAEIVFVDEISRTRPDLQNKLFPIIYEKRVQGIDLEKLRFRWAAMNPPPPEDASDENLDVYFGSEPLDPALADRFSFIIEVPSWQQLTEDEKRSVLRDQFVGEQPFGARPLDMIAYATERYIELTQSPPREIAEYLILLLTSLQAQALSCSARRATILHRNILAVHAARMALYHQAWPDVPVQALDWSTSALTAVMYSLPHTAQGREPDPSLLLGSHRQAWEVVKLDENNPWRLLLGIDDPMERCLTAVEMRDRVSDDDLSQLILEGLSSIKSGPQDRLPEALAIYLALHRDRHLRATVYETLGRMLRDVLRPERRQELCAAKSYMQRAHDLAQKLRTEAEGEGDLLKRYGANLVMGIAYQGFGNFSPANVYRRFESLYRRLVSEPKEGSI